MDAFQQTGSVVLVLGLLAAALWWLRRKGLAQFAVGGLRRKAERRMELIERLPLTPNHSLHLVRVADKTVLIALSPSGCTVLSEVGL